MTEQPPGYTGRFAEQPPGATPPPPGAPDWPSAAPGIPGNWPVPPAPELQDPGYLRALLSYLAVGIGVGILLAVLGGWLWSVVADPPTAPLARNGGVYLGEQALNQQSGVTLWFLVLGAGIGLIAGLTLAWFGRRIGWPAVFCVLLMCALAAAGSRWLGVHAFGPDPATEITHAHTGSPITLNLGLQTWVAYLGWGIGGMAGAVAAIAGWSIRRPSDARGSSNAPVAPTSGPAQPGVAWPPTS